MKNIKDKQKGIEKKYKCIHYVSYISGNNSSGCFEFFSNWEKIETKTKLDNCIRIIKERNPQFSSIIITSILTVSNK